MKYEFDFEKFQKMHGKLCPCLIPRRDTAVQENMCPCKTFVKHGVCRCGLFKEV